MQAVTLVTGGINAFLIGFNCTAAPCDGFVQFLHTPCHGAALFLHRLLGTRAFR